MTTRAASWRLPEELLDSLKGEAERRGISQAKIIVQALERELKDGDWGGPVAKQSAIQTQVPEIAGLVPASQLKPPSQTDCKHTNALIHRGGGRYSCRRCGEVVQNG